MFILKKITWSLCILFLIMYVAYIMLPTTIQNPVEGIRNGSYDLNTFWHLWGDHRHRGIDIFADRGTPVHPATSGIVTSVGRNRGAGGNWVEIFSTGFRFHYYAHMDTLMTHRGAFVTQQSIIGKVGNTGNAAGKPCHLHYSISSPIPSGDWRYDRKTFAFYVNPIVELQKAYPDEPFIPIDTIRSSMAVP